MAMTFADLYSEVKRRATRNQSGTTFDIPDKNAVNAALFRVARERNWTNLRRTSIITCDAPYTTGSGAVAVTNGSSTVTVTGATFITDGIKIGRRVQLGGSQKNYIITSITGETTMVVNLTYDGTNSTSQTYSIFGTEEYNMPIQCDRIRAIWHEGYGYPFLMMPTDVYDFYASGVNVPDSDIPVFYRQWNSDTIIRQPNSASVVTISSSSSSDTSKNITVFGTVSGYPDYEIITTNSGNGTTTVSGTKSFSTVERVVKGSSTVGRITLTCNSGNVTIAVLPVGDTTGTIQYKKIQIFPLPNSAYQLNVLYYKEPWRLVNDDDIHELGQEFDEAIIMLATSKILQEQGKKEGDKFFAMYQDEIRNLGKNNVDVLLDIMPHLRKAKNARNLNGAPLSRWLSYGQLGGGFGPHGYL